MTSCGHPAKVVRMERFLHAMAGFAIGIIVSLAVTSSDWLVDSLRHHLSWDHAELAISAVSNLVVAITAVLGVIYILRQLRQNDKQVRIALGDEDPEMDVVEHFRTTGVFVVRIVNYNRRSLLVDSVDITDMDGQARVMRAENRDGEFQLSSIATFDPPLTVWGWQARSEQPNFLRLDVIKERLIEGMEPGWTGGQHVVDVGPNSRAVVKGRMIGSNKPVDLTSAIVTRS